VIMSVLSLVYLFACEQDNPESYGRNRMKFLGCTAPFGNRMTGIPLGNDLDRKPRSG